MTKKLSTVLVIFWEADWPETELTVFGPWQYIKYDVWHMLQTIIWPRGNYYIPKREISEIHPEDTVNFYQSATFLTWKVHPASHGACICARYFRWCRFLHHLTKSKKFSNVQGGQMCCNLFDTCGKEMSQNCHWGCSFRTVGYHAVFRL